MIDGQMDRGRREIQREGYGGRVGGREIWSSGWRDDAWMELGSDGRVEGGEGGSEGWE